MAEDWLPRADGEFHAWQENFVTYANANLAGLGLVLGDMTAVTTAQTTWKVACPAQVAALAEARNATQAKEAARVGYELAIRPLVNWLQASSAVSDPERASLGITVRDKTRTPVAAPTTRPVVSVDSNERLRHTINFTDESTPTRKAKPAGVNGAEVWVKNRRPPRQSTQRNAHSSRSTRERRTSPNSMAPMAGRWRTTCYDG